MLYFDFAAYVRQNWRAVFRSRGTPYRLTPKRAAFLFLFNLFYIILEIINHFFFLLDEIFFPAYRQQEIRKPVFIIGNPRSGTTFLHRLMFKDKDTFTAFTVWELAIAPSITQRKIIWFFSKIGKAIGRPLSRAAQAINKSLRKGKAHVAHTVRIEEAEEDEHIMFHCWASETMFNLYPYLDEVYPYFYFDREIPRERQEKMMRFYRRMLQKHLYAHGGNQILLSKNPSHSSRIAALSREFPDAHFIKLVRNPFEALPSMLDAMSIGINLFCDPPERYPFTQQHMELMKYYYLYPLEFFKDKPDKCKFIQYEELVAHPDVITRKLYEWLNLPISPTFAAELEAETKAEKHYHSQHRYPLEEMGLTEEQIFDEFREVFSIYAFDQHEFELPEEAFGKEQPEWASRRKQKKTKGGRGGKQKSFPEHSIPN